MTFIGDKETFTFDVRGYIIFKRFVPASTIERINQVIDSSPVKEQAPKFGFVTLDPVFMDIISDERILETCAKWIDPHFRFAHAWGIQQFKGAEPTINNLHAGPFDEQGFFQYSWHGQPRATCLNFALATEPQLLGDGGFVVVPGSHKANLPVNGDAVYIQLLDYSIENTDLVMQPVLEPGDLLCFSEAMMHGSADWQPTERRRRIVYFKYCLGSMTWLQSNDSDLDFLREHARNAQEELLFQPPCVGMRDRVGGDFQWRPRTWLNMKEPQGNLLVKTIRRLPTERKRQLLALFEQIPETPRKQILRLLK